MCTSALLAVLSIPGQTEGILLKPIRLQLRPRPLNARRIAEPETHQGGRDVANGDIHYLPTRFAGSIAGVSGNLGPKFRLRSLVMAQFFICKSPTESFADIILSDLQDAERASAWEE